MRPDEATYQNDLEEAAQGTDLFRAPGDELSLEEARDKAEASGWIPDGSADSTTGRLARVKAHRRTLREAMKSLEDMISRSPSLPNWPELVNGALNDLGVAIRKHVTDVESDRGLLEAIRGTAPRLSVEIDGIREEHVSLLDEWDRVHRTVSDSGAIDQAVSDNIRQRVLSLLNRLSQHRQRGADLVYEAYNVDIAAAD